MSMATKTSGVPEAALCYFDTIVLSNFALSGRFDLLIDRYGPRAQITPEVFREADLLLQNMIDAGYFSPVDQISGLL